MGSSLTIEQAESLLGCTGRVRNPAKGEWDGDYRCVGFEIDSEKLGAVKSVKLESIELQQQTPVTTQQGSEAVTRLIPEVPGPKYRAHAVDPRWFGPARDLLVSVAPSAADSA